MGMRISIYLIICILFLASCSQAATSIHAQTIPSQVVESSREPKATKTPQISMLRPSRTISSTPTATATSTYPTPTFDARKVVIKTSQPAALCKVEDPNLKPNLKNIINESFIYDLSPSILEYLNAGGTYEPLTVPIKLKPAWFDKEITVELDITRLDVTNDGIPEIILHDPVSFNIFGCQNGQYITLMHAYGDHFPDLIDSRDLNLDGIPDLLLGVNYCGNCIRMEYYIFSWNGTAFENQLKNPGYSSFYHNISTDEYKYGYISVFSDEINYGIINVDGVADENTGLDSPIIKDLDGNGTKELIITGGIPVGYSLHNGGPWRVETVIFSWNGSSYSIVDWKTKFPRYRFQAVQDGDVYTLLGKYDLAMSSYQRVIFDEMDYWSYARLLYVRDTYYSSSDLLKPTPTQPGPDPAEYPNLAAYARFRIMVLHVIQGHLPDARTVYETLLSKYPTGTEGAVFSELARIFWDEFQHSKDTGSSCSKVIQKVSEDRVTYLKYLGNLRYDNEPEYSEGHGWWSLYYAPEDVCPYK
jgi:hypothetical protein